MGTRETRRIASRAHVTGGGRGKSCFLEQAKPHRDARRPCPQEKQKNKDRNMTGRQRRKRLPISCMRHVILGLRPHSRRMVCSRRRDMYIRRPVGLVAPLSRKLAHIHAHTHTPTTRVSTTSRLSAPYKPAAALLPPGIPIKFRIPAPPTRIRRSIAACAFLSCLPPSSLVPPSLA